YQGTGVLDLRSLTLYADQVIVRSPLRFPRTDVTIHARELIFEGEGRIDTSPIPFRQKRAVSPHKTKDGDPADENGKPTYRAAAGRDGEKAGDIRLHVGKIL